MKSTITCSCMSVSPRRPGVVGPSTVGTRRSRAAAMRAKAQRPKALRVMAMWSHFRALRVDLRKRQVCPYTVVTLRFFQISTGLGAGNVGDEIMARAFWECMPPEWELEVELFEESRRYRGNYPPSNAYCSVTDGSLLRAAERGIAGLLACGTPVNE